MHWSFGDLLEGVESIMPDDAPALIHDDRVVTWSEYAARSNALARALRARGAEPGDKLAFYLRNGSEYGETLGASFKARLVHTNVNFRYLDEELVYILDNSDARFVVFDAEFSERVRAVRTRCPKVATWLQVGASPGESLPFAERYEALVAEGDGAPLGLARSPEDLLFVYTGGTTGMPKAVMWRHGDLWQAVGGGSQIPATRGSRPETPEAFLACVRDHGPGPRQLVACPLMHGTGLFASIGTLLGGGCVATVGGANFDPVRLFDAVERHRIQSIVIVGDAFARPMLRALDAEPGRWDLSSLRVIVSSGVMWSREVKQGLLKHQPDVTLADLFGSSEAVGFGRSLTSAKGERQTARFEIGESCKVFTEDHREVVPGSGEPGTIARTGAIPLGYYKDEAKTAKTFPTLGGVRWAIPGDWCTVEADGTITLLGRGSACINTAGEKVYPEEVEEVLKTHRDVEDALVFGLADERWGQAVTAVVTLRAGARFDESALRDHVRARLAGYKTPKRLFRGDRAFRAANGKADYRSAAAHAWERLADEWERLADER